MAVRIVGFELVGIPHCAFEYSVQVVHRHEFVHTDGRILSFGKVYVIHITDSVHDKDRGETLYVSFEIEHVDGKGNNRRVPPFPRHQQRGQRQWMVAILDDMV